MLSSRIIGTGAVLWRRPLSHTCRRALHESVVFQYVRSSSANQPKQNRFANKFSKTSDKPLSAKKPGKRVLKFEVEKFTPKAKSAILSVIEDVRNKSPRFKVKFVKAGKILDRNLVEIVNGLSEEEGVQLVPNSEGELMVKKVTKDQMLKVYSDKLAQEKEALLLEQGSASTLRALRNKEKAERKKASVKGITLKWSISLGDLRLQKRAEIQKNSNKGEKFMIYIDGRKPRASNISAATLSNAEEVGFDDSTEKLDPIESKRRGMIYEEILQMLEEFETKCEVTGSMSGLLIINCTPKEKKSVDKTKLKMEKKQKQLEKQKQREQKAKIAEEDLDSLYLFKIED